MSVYIHFESWSQSLYEAALLLRKQCDLKKKSGVRMVQSVVFSVAKVCMRLP